MKMIGTTFDNQNVFWSGKKSRVSPLSALSNDFKQAVGVHVPVCAVKKNSDSLSILYIVH